jgi:hypothetical protein
MRWRFLRIFCGILLAALGVVTSGYAQSPWVRSKAGFYLQAAWQTTPRYKEIFSATGKDQPLDRQLTESTLHLYGEYGITRLTTLVVTLPFRFQKAGEFLENTPSPQTNAGSLSGLGNTSIGLRHAILNGNWPLTGFLRVDLPVDNYNNDTGLRTGYRSLTVLPMLSTGKKFSQSYWFVYTGYAFRTRNYNAYTNAGLEAGYRIRKVWAIAFSELVLPTSSDKQPDLDPSNLLTGLYVNGQAYLSLGLKGIFEVHRFWGLTASVTGVGWGKLVPKQPAFGVGAYFKWD